MRYLNSVLLLMNTSVGCALRSAEIRIVKALEIYLETKIFYNRPV